MEQCRLARIPVCTSDYEAFDSTFGLVGNFTEGELLQSFRPSDDGNLLNLEDDEIELAADSQIKIAHVVLISAEC